MDKQVKIRTNEDILKPIGRLKGSKIVFGLNSSPKFVSKITLLKAYNLCTHGQTRLLNLICVDILSFVRLELFTFDFMECLVCCRRNLSQDVFSLLHFRAKQKHCQSSLNQTYMYTHLAGESQLLLTSLLPATVIPKLRF